MSYCRFENTYGDLKDCLEALSESDVKTLEKEVNEYEKPYIRKLIKLCGQIAADYGENEDEGSKD